MVRLILTRGLPGSGKTTRAVAWVAVDPARRARVNRDDTRTMLHGGRLGTAEQEDQVTTATEAATEALLRAGIDVVCDDTNLDDQHVQRLCELADRVDAAVEVWDLTDVPVDVCIARDAARGRAGGRSVGEAVIRELREGLLAAGCPSS